MSLTDELEARARGEIPRPGRFALRIVEAALIVASCLLVGILLYEAQFSGTVRWLLGFALVVAIVLWAWSRVSRGTEEPAPLAPPLPAGAVRTGELAALTAAARRAEEGLEYSQLLVSSRARDAFAERARLALGLSPEAVRAMASDPAVLRLRIHDGALEALLFRGGTGPAERYRWVRAARAGDGFSPSLEEVLDRMEAWR